MNVEETAEETTRRVSGLTSISHPLPHSDALNLIRQPISRLCEPEVKRSLCPSL